MLSQIDLTVGAGTTTLLLLLAALLFRDFRTVAAGRLAIFFALGSAAHALTASSGFAPPVTPWQAALIAVSTGNVVVFWLFARALFDDTFELRRWHAVPWAAVVALSLTNCLVLVPAQTLDSRIFAVAISVISLAFVALAVGQTIASWSTDLVEDRRRLRVFVVGATAVYAGFNAVAQIFLPASGSPNMVVTLNAAILAAVVIAIAVSLTRIRGETIFALAEKPAAVAGASNESNTADRKLLDALMRLMSNERIYRREGITIGTLATKLAVPEYKLRRLINRQLGYRNFSVFLNNHRIEEAKAALADPSQAEVPVITIAMDAGFQSLGPFNRAFKATTGVTARDVPKEAMTQRRRLNTAGSTRPARRLFNLLRKIAYFEIGEAVHFSARAICKSGERSLQPVSLPMFYALRLLFPVSIPAGSSPRRRPRYLAPACSAGRWITRSIRRARMSW